MKYIALGVVATIATVVLFIFLLTAMKGCAESIKDSYAKDETVITYRHGHWDTVIVKGKVPEWTK